MNADRDSWTHEVDDIHGEKVQFGVRAVGGYVIFSGPNWFKTNPDDADRVDINVRLAANRAREQRLNDRWRS